MTEHENAETMHAFWSTQPVSQTANEVVTAAGPRETKTLEDVPKEPYAVASTFEWWTPNILDDADLEQLYQLLCDNYVEDDDSMFRFKYSKEFLRWALTPPGYVPDWLVAVRRKKDHQMLAFIAGIPLSVRMGTPQQLIKDAGEAETDSDPHFLKPRRICEINFLCIHKKLRAKRMAPLLIREITRRVNLHGIWQAIYTAGVVVPTPFATAQYYHRSLNPEKLVATHFSSMPPSFEKFPSPMAMLKRVYSVAQKPQCRGWRDMRAGDVPAVAELLKQSLAKYDVAPCFNEEEVRHMLLPREGVVYSYVIEDSKTSEVTDFASFYSLPSTVIGNSKYSQLNAAYVLYYAANTVPIEKLITDTLIMAVANNFDVMNMVDILQNSAFTKELRFGIGDGKLHYYLYNWFYPKTEPSQVALVML